MNKRNFIGYANELPDPKWPKKSIIAINFVINVEEGSEYSPLYGKENSETSLSEVPGGRHKKYERDLGIESIYEYGSRSGFWRIVNIFDQQKIPVTYFVCADALNKNYKIADYIRKSKNDVCGHGFRWTEHFKMNRKL